MTHEKFSNLIKYGIDAKLLQYEDNATDICHDLIDLRSILAHSLGKNVAMNCVMINLEKDVKRYESAVNELKKLQISEFIHLKGTYWKDRSGLVNDLNNILDFLRVFNDDVPSAVKLNDFSEISDSNIAIQDGPLACYCSHLRAWIYAYYHFSDYVLVVEDDLAVVNTDKIARYVKEVDEDWDIICFNSAPKNTIYTTSWYRFIEPFHSTHFYIIRHNSLKKLFKTMYPVYDQVDVLLANRIGDLKIFNIPDTVYQKNWSTNTQNNLHAIFESPNYAILRTHVSKAYQMLKHYTDKLLPNNEHNDNIIDTLMNDVVFDYVVRDESNKSIGSIETYDFDDTVFFDDDEYIELLKSIEIFLNCVKKGIQPISQARLLVGIMLYTLIKFNKHHMSDNYMGDVCKAYSYGSTSHVYKLDSSNIILKCYNDLFRWTCEGHSDSRYVMLREVEILKILRNENISPIMKHYDVFTRQIWMTYEGPSLYDHFELPLDWRGQISQMFAKLSNAGVYYPEFKLQNIVCNCGVLKLIDFGLACAHSPTDNDESCNAHLKHLANLENKFSTLTDRRSRQRLYHTYCRNHGL